MPDVLTIPKGLDLQTPVPAGLRIQPSPTDGTGLKRFDIVHESTGRVLCGPAGDRCPEHLDQALALVAATGIDWTLPDPATPNADTCLTMRASLLALDLCFDPETGRFRACPNEVTS